MRLASKKRRNIEAQQPAGSLSDDQSAIVDGRCPTRWVVALANLGRPTTTRLTAILLLLLPTLRPAHDAFCKLFDRQQRFKEGGQPFLLAKPPCRRAPFSEGINGLLNGRQTRSCFVPPTDSAQSGNPVSRKSLQ
uniref:Uncharacterized protein n=1 Tax=Trichuris muris TaxID=70415 RepID=A0A5S6QS85_TRIMR